MAAVDSVDDSLLSQLDWKYQEILLGIYDIDGRATTTEIKHRTDITDTDYISYRFRRSAVALEPHGLVEVHEPDLTASDRSRPLEVTLTEKGERLTERLIDTGRQTHGVEERLEQLEAALDSLETTVDEQCNGTEQTGETSGDDLDVQLAAIKGRLTHLEDTLDGEYGGWSGEKQRDHETMTDGTRAIRDFLLEHHGDEFRQYIEDHTDV
jgi:hypothetical protein